MLKGDIRVTKSDERKYVLSTDTDYKILRICKQLEKMKLSKEDMLLIKFIKTQLERDWRKPLLIKLNCLLRKYRK